MKSTLPLRTVTAMALSGLLGGCAALGGDEPDQAQRDAWQVAVEQANPRFSNVAVEGPFRGGFTSYTFIAVEVESELLTAADVQSLVDAVDASTEDAYTGHTVQVGFEVADPDSKTGIALIDLTDIADEAMVYSSGSRLIFPAGSES